MTRKATIVVEFEFPTCVAAHFALKSTTMSLEVSIYMSVFDSIVNWWGFFREGVEYKGVELREVTKSWEYKGLPRILGVWKNGYIWLE